MATGDAEYIGVSELAAAVGTALAEIADIDKRMKSGATEIPTERTIRFYLEKGLLPKPSKRLGQTLVFGRLHLLQLLVIKKLQADGVPLSAIPEVLTKRGKTEVQLEELLRETKNSDSSIPRLSLGDLAMAQRPQALRSTSPGTPDSRQRDYESDPETQPARKRMNRLTVEPRRQQHAQLHPPPATAFGDTPPPASEAKSFLRSLLSRSSRPEASQEIQVDTEPDLTVLYSAPSPRSATPQSIWGRHQPAPGVEINVSHDYEPPRDEQGKANLLEQIKKILGL
jgi:DNA-binding transcriptional MerR regulator